MNGTRPLDVESVVRDWLLESRPALSDAALDAALAVTRVSPSRPMVQSRRPVGWLLAASLAGIALVAALSLLRVLEGSGPASTPPTLPSVAPSVTPVTESELSGLWYPVDRPASSGGSSILRLTEFASLQASDGTYFGLSPWSVAGSAIVFEPLAGGACAGLGATYDAALDGSVLVLAPTIDDCDARARALGGRWERIPDGSTLADRFRFPFVYRAPDGKLLFENSTQMHLLASNDGVDQPSGFGIWVAEAGFEDACEGAGSVRIPPGADGLLGFLRSIESLDVGEPRSVVFDGRPAIVVDVRAVGTACSGDYVRVWRDTGEAFRTPRDDWFAIPVGGNAEILLVEIDGSTVGLAAWAPGGEEPMTAQIERLLADLRFLAPAP